VARAVVSGSGFLPIGIESNGLGTLTTPFRNCPQPVDLLTDIINNLRKFLEFGDRVT